MFLGVEDVMLGFWYCLQSLRRQDLNIRFVRTVPHFVLFVLFVI
jgi:hypothetical protein